MFSKLSVSTLIAAFALAGVAHAEVTPSEPGPGQVFNTGATCTVSWEGDKVSTTEWKGMNIQLMTGDNFAMVHLTTIASDQDGTVDGRVNYPCPEVTINSNVFFYQFSSPGAPNKTWTTRFTIASASGETVPPPNPTQPGTNDPVPWGTGALVDASSAVPPPASAEKGDSPAAGNSTTSAGSTTTSATSTGTRSTGTSTATTSAARNTTTAAAGANSTSANQNAENGAVGSMGAGVLLGSVVAVASSALALAISL